MFRSRKYQTDMWCSGACAGSREVAVGSGKRVGGSGGERGIVKDKNRGNGREITEMT